MSVRAASSLVLQAIFVFAIVVAYLGIAIGSVGYLRPGSASLVTLTGCAVGCIAWLGFFLVSKRELRRSS
jgi:hypothetical protein